MENIETLREAIPWFLAYCEKERKLSLHSIKAYGRDLALLLSFTSEKADSPALRSIGRSLIREWLRTMTAVKARTVKRRLATVKSMFSALERHGLAADNVLAGLRSEVKLGYSLPRSVGRNTMQIVLKAARGPRPSRTASPGSRTFSDRTLIELLFATGVRVGELVSLNISDVDLDRLTLSIRGKGNRERQIPVACEVVGNLLSRHLRYRVKDGAEPHDPLFLNRRFTRLSDQSVRGLLGRISTSSVGKRITPHMVRHTLATLLLEEGVDLRNIQRLLGHSSITTTTIYVHVSEQGQRDTLTKLHPRNRMKI